jgi:hypothetical protein
MEAVMNDDDKRLIEEAERLVAGATQGPWEARLRNHLALSAARLRAALDDNAALIFAATEAQEACLKWRTEADMPDAKYGQRRMPLW